MVFLDLYRLIVHPGICWDNWIFLVTIETIWYEIGSGNSLFLSPVFKSRKYIQTWNFLVNAFEFQQKLCRQQWSNIAFEHVQNTIFHHCCRHFEVNKVGFQTEVYVFNRIQSNLELKVHRVKTYFRHCRYSATESVRWLLLIGQYHPLKPGVGTIRLNDNITRC